MTSHCTVTFEMDKVEKILNFQNIFELYFSEPF